MIKHLGACNSGVCTPKPEWASEGRSFTPKRIAVVLEKSHRIGMVAIVGKPSQFEGPLSCPLMSELKEEEKLYYHSLLSLNLHLVPPSG